MSRKREDASVETNGAPVTATNASPVIAGDVTSPGPSLHQYDVMLGSWPRLRIYAESPELACARYKEQLGIFRDDLAPTARPIMAG